MWIKAQINQTVQLSVRAGLSAQRVGKISPKCEEESHECVGCHDQ